MRIVFVIGMLLALSGCASRDVTFLYYPNAPPNAKFPRSQDFYADAEKECGKYGLAAVYYWTTYGDFDRVKVIYNCVRQ